MKTMIGFTAGVATGMYVSSKMSQHQRTQLAARTAATVRRTASAVKDSTVGESVADNVAKVTDAASERVADAIDDVGARAANAVQADSANEHRPGAETATP